MNEELLNPLKKAIKEGEQLKEQEYAIRKDKANAGFSDLQRRQNQQKAFDEMVIGDDVEERSAALILENREYLKLAKNATPFLGLEEFKDKLAIFPRSLILFLAKTGTGKSTTVANFVENYVRKGKNVLILTNEEYDTDILNRIICLMKGWSYNNHDEITEEQQLEFDRLYPLLSQRITIINDTYKSPEGGVTTTFEGIRGICHKLGIQRKNGGKVYDAILLDYVQNVRTSTQNPRLEQWGVLGRLLAFFDGWKSQYPAPILLFSQVKAESKDDGDVKNRIEGYKAIMNHCTSVIEVIADRDNLRTEWKFAKNRFKGAVGISVFTGYDKGKYVAYDQTFITETRLNNDRKNQNKLMGNIHNK